MKVVEPKTWKLVLMTAGVLVAAVLLLGTAPPQKPLIADTGKTGLSGVPPQKPVKTKPLVIRRTVQVQETTAPAAPPEPVQEVKSSVGGLTGSVGYAIPFGNCVNQINPRPNGNPITWPVRSQTPAIGMAALWSYNHVGRVVGIWDNGDLEIAHENYQGGQTRFPRSAFRGFW